MRGEVMSGSWSGKSMMFRRDTYSINLMMKAVSQIERDRTHPLVGQLKQQRVPRIPRNEH